MSNRYGKKPGRRKIKAKARKTVSRWTKKGRPRRKSRRRRRVKYGKVFRPRSATQNRARRRRDLDPVAEVLRQARKSPSRWTASATRRRQAEVARRCAICGDPTDHGGDGHPFERWTDEGERVVVRPRAPSPFVIRHVFGVTRASDMLQ